MDDKPYWVALNMVRGIGAVRLRALIEHFGDAASAWTADADALRESGLNPKVVDRILDLRNSLDVFELWDRIAAQGIHVITCQDDTYPARLKEIDQPPPVLYVRGELLPEDDFAVAIVGTRRITPYGRQVTEELAAFLGSNGITVISGLARGVDAAAHTSALRAGGRTIAVLGSGVDRIYPGSWCRCRRSHLRITRRR
jgi:DNA processing protein